MVSSWTPGGGGESACEPAALPGRVSIHLLRAGGYHMLGPRRRPSGGLGCVRTFHLRRSFVKPENTPICVDFARGNFLQSIADDRHEC